MRIDLVGTRWRWAFLIAAVAVQSASANLILDGPAEGDPAALGLSNVVLTIQNLGTEEGCVSFGNVIGGSACPAGLSPSIVGGNEQTGPIFTTRTETVAGTGVSSGDDLVSESIAAGGGAVALTGAQSGVTSDNATLAKIDNGARITATRIIKNTGR